ncbi:MAG: Hpt domain-containing protein [Thermoanaerobaculia bacterium]|nr:Hpt domain-containing protein [Thermoanaerobaculia bacterium]
MKLGIDFVVLDGPVAWSDDYELESTMVELDGFMIADLRAYREGLFASMLALFEDQAPMRIDAIRAALEVSDFDNLRHQAHELAGGAAYVGAASLACHARAIETLAKGHRLQDAAPLVAAIEQHVQRTMGALRTFAIDPEGDPAS